MPYCFQAHLIAALLFFQPLILQRFTADQFDMGKLVFLYWIVASLLLVSLVASRETNWIFRLDTLNIAVFALLAFSLISTLASVHSPTSFFGGYQRYEGWLTLLCLIILFQFARGRSRGERRWAELGITASIVLVSIYGVMQRFNLDPVTWSEKVKPFGERVFSTIGNPVMLGGFLVLTLPICLGIIIRENKFARILGIVGWVLGLICLYFTESEGAWFGFWIGILTLVLFVGCRPKARFRWIRWVSVSLFILTCLWVSGLYFTRNPLLFSSTGQIRMEFYKGAARIFLAKPLFGSGPDTLRLAFPQFKSLMFAKEWGGRNILPARAHNLFMEVLATYGIFAFFSLMLVISLATAYGYRQIRQDQESVMNPFILSGVIGYLAYLMTGLTEISVSPTWWVLMGFLAGRPLECRTLKQLSVPRMGLVVGAIPIGLILVAVSFSQAVADHNYLLAEGTPDLITEDGYYLRAERFNPYNHIYFVDHGFRWVEKGIEENDHEQWQKGVAILRKATETSPLEAETHINLGIAYNRGARQFSSAYYLDGIQALKQAAKVSPLMLDVHYQLSVAFLSLGRYKDALQESEETLRIDPGNVAAYVLQAGALFNLGQIAEAKRVLIKAKALSPQDRQIQDALKFIEEKEST